MTKKDVEKYILSVKWQFAKTMPEIPHEYTVVDWNSDKKETFYNFVRYIHKHGSDNIFSGRKYRYLIFGDYKYWTMGEAIAETKLINREMIKIT